MAAHFLFLALLALASSHAIAFDPSQLQYFCIADLKSADVVVNGFVCKDLKLAKADHFFFYGLDKPSDTGNKLGSNVTQVNVNQIPGLNTLGIVLAWPPRLCTLWCQPSLRPPKGN
ncbi:putative Germin-like protein subfamily 1 member 13 [Cocos nucifera]|nr:putative Germin-like protein subfamily 1 member 13 [Cocos nucifera]